MCRVAWVALVALGMVGAAAAQDFDVEGWRRVDISRGQPVWVSSNDFYAEPGGDRQTIRVLWTHPSARSLPAGTRYTISSYAFDCRGAGVTETTWPFDARGEPLEQGPEQPEREVRPGTVIGALFDLACEGARFEDDLELGSAREVLDYEARHGGSAPQARPANRWDSGPGGPEEEPREPSGEGQR